MMARALIAPETQDMWATLCATRKLPPHVGPTCARLIGDALSQLWPCLWRRGGTAPGASIRGEEVVRGRLWERYAPVGLAHTRATLMLLKWLVSTPFAAAPSTYPVLPAMQLAIGDQVVLYLALDASRGTQAQIGLAMQPFTKSSGLAWLGYAHHIEGVPDPGVFDALTSGAGAIVVEALTGEIGKRWRSMEIAKRSIRDPQRLATVGAAQDQTLQGFMAACDRAKRRDLAVFVIDAIEPLLAKNVGPMPPPLDPTAPLSVRAAARVAAGSLIRGLLKWRDWNNEHRSVRFIDDGYQAAQLLLHRFEKVGNHGAELASGWLGQLSSLTPATVEPPGVSE
jgi:hypothetical protein